MSLAIIVDIEVEQRQGIVVEQFEKLQEEVPADGEELDWGQ